jgi:hypothetical protein
MNTAKLLQQLETERQGWAETISRCDQRLAQVEKKIERQSTAPTGDPHGNLRRSLAAALRGERQRAVACLRHTETRITQARKCAEQNAAVARLDLIGC